MIFMRLLVLPVCCPALNPFPHVFPSPDREKLSGAGTPLCSCGSSAHPHTLVDPSMPWSVRFSCVPLLPMPTFP